MNKNELVNNVRAPLGDAYYHFQEKYLFSRNLWFAVGCAAGFLALKGMQMHQERRDERLTQEINQFLADNIPKQELNDTPEQDAA